MELLCLLTLRGLCLLVVATVARSWVVVGDHRLGKFLKLKKSHLQYSTTCINLPSLQEKFNAEDSNKFKPIFYLPTRFVPNKSVNKNLHCPFTCILLSFECVFKLMYFI